MGCQRLGSRQLVAQRRVASVFSRLYHGMRGGRSGCGAAGPGSNRRDGYARWRQPFAYQVHARWLQQSPPVPSFHTFLHLRLADHLLLFHPSRRIRFVSFFASSILHLLSPRYYSSVSASFFFLLLLFLCSIPPLLCHLFQPGSTKEEEASSSSNLLPLAFSLLFLSLFLAHSSSSLCISHSPPL